MDQIVRGAVRRADDVPARILTIDGSVKWFNEAKYFGFITPSSKERAIDGDVLLHAACLKDYGLQTISEGATVRAEVSKANKGWRVFRILMVDNSTAVEKPHRTPIPRAAVKAIRGPTSAVCKRFFVSKGFGFVRCEGETVDTMIHMVIIKERGMDPPLPGDVVKVVYGEGPKGLIAIEIHPGD